MNRLISYINAWALVLAHAACTVLIVVFSRKLFADEGNDTKGFFTLKFSPKLADRGLGNAIQAASQAAGQGQSAVNGAKTTANKVVSSAEAIVTSAVDKILHENAGLSLGTSQACVSAGEASPICVSIPHPSASSDDGPEQETFQHAVEVVGNIAKAFGKGGWDSLLTDIATKADSWWLTPSRMAEAGMVTAILSTVVYCVSLCAGGTSYWVQSTLTLFVITLGILSVAIFGGLRYTITTVNSIASRTVGHAGQFLAGPSLRDSDVSMVSAIAQVVITALHAIYHYLTNKESKGDRKTAVESDKHT